MLPVISEFQRTSTDNMDSLVYFIQAAEYFWDSALEATRNKDFNLADHNFVEAFKKYHACRRIDSFNHYYFHQMGMCLYSLSYFPDAEAKNKSLLIAHDAFKNAIDLHKSAYPKPDVDQRCVRAMYIRDLVNCLIDLEQYKEADTILGKAVELDPTPLSLAHLGVLKATYLGQAEIGKTYFSEAFASAARNKDKYPNDAAAAAVHAGLLRLGRESSLIPPLNLVR